jgi:hypothetical protein
MRKHSLEACKNGRSFEKVWLRDERKMAWGKEGEKEEKLFAN